MSQTTRLCHGCAEPLPNAHPRERNPRKWCSGACRVRTHYARNGKPVPEPQSWMKVNFLNCSVCDTLFTTRRHRRWCSPECRRALKVADEATRRTSLTGEELAAYRLRRRGEKAVRKARLRGANAERFDPREVYERDSWTCGICTDPVDQSLTYPHPMSASLDHVVPVSLGGDHTRANTRCSHLTCNVRRGNRDLLNTADKAS